MLTHRLMIGRLDGRLLSSLAGAFACLSWLGLICHPVDPVGVDLLIFVT